MNDIIKPTRQELKIIRDAGIMAARREGGKGTIKLEAGQRHALKAPFDRCSVNILLVDDSPDWDNSDLYTTVDWEDLKKGFEAAPGGKAELDFYCYDCNYELCDNIQAVWINKKLFWVGRYGSDGVDYFGETPQNLRDDT